VLRRRLLQLDTPQRALEVDDPDLFGLQRIVSGILVPSLVEPENDARDEPLIGREVERRPSRESAVRPARVHRGHVGGETLLEAHVWALGLTDPGQAVSTPPRHVVQLAALAGCWLR